MEKRKLVVASDKYKGCLSSPEVCSALAGGFQQVAGNNWKVITAPQADGGEGTVDALVTSLDGQYRTTKVEGPRGDKVEATWGLVNQPNQPLTAIIEMAAASGLALLEPDQQNPLHTSTYGTGQIIREAAREGAKQILLGIGGSATVDGGLGVALALGFKVLDNTGKPVGKAGKNLQSVSEIDDHSVQEEVKQLDLKIACDVDNPLLGEEGAAQVYGPQKGAPAQMVPRLEKGLKNWAGVVEHYAGRKLREAPGTGAAGGLGFGLMGLLDAKLTGGAELVADLTGLNSALNNADVLITGEGTMDAQTAYGKTPQVVAERGRKQDVKLIIGIAGAQDEGYRELYPTFDLLLGLPRKPITLEESLNQTREALQNWGADLGRLVEKLY